MARDAQSWALVGRSRAAAIERHIVGLSAPLQHLKHLGIPILENLDQVQRLDPPAILTIGRPKVGTAAVPT